MACFSSGSTAITRVGRGREFYAKACELSFKGIVSKRADAPYTPGDRGLWVKTKCSHRQEFIVIGWTDPEGVRRWLGRCCSAIVAEFKYLTLAGENLLGQVVYEVLREDKPAAEVRRPAWHNPQ